MQGHFKKANVSPVKFLKEFRLQDSAEATRLDQRFWWISSRRATWWMLSGVSKGKGFAGVIKRHHFGGGAATHGSMFHRAPGSIGASAFPSRVFKGMRRAAGTHGHKDSVSLTEESSGGQGRVPSNNLLDGEEEQCQGARTAGYLIITKNA